MRFTWSETKNERLMKERGISFEEVLMRMDQGCLIDIVEHPNQAKYPGQRIFVMSINDYVYLVPFEEMDDRIELKTIIPSRKETRKYIQGAKDHEETE